MPFRRVVVVSILSVFALVVAACSSGSDAPQQSSTPASSTPAPTTTTSSTTPSPSSTSFSPTTTSSSTSSPTPTTSSTPPKPAAKDPLTGLTLSKNPVVAVKIDNTGAGFPQFGITAADIIYTEQVEGGLTRLIVIFHTTLPEEVGAVRSIRSTDMQLLPSYGKPILVASGGATAQLRRLHNTTLVGVINDAGDGGFWRSSFGDGTHNLHANLQKIVKAHPGKGKAQPMGFAFNAKDSRLSKARKVSTIDVTMLAGRYRFSYADGKYLAHHSGTPYVDHQGKKVYVQNVLVQQVHDEPDGTLDPIGNPSYLSHTVGSGKFTLYRNGRAISGTWSRKTAADPTRFLDAKGKPVSMMPGKAWVLLAPQTSRFNNG